MEMEIWLTIGPCRKFDFHFANKIEYFKCTFKCVIHFAICNYCELDEKFTILYWCPHPILLIYMWLANTMNMHNAFKRNLRSAVIFQCSQLGSSPIFENLDVKCRLSGPALPSLVEPNWATSFFHGLPWLKCRVERKKRKKKQKDSFNTIKWMFWPVSREVRQYHT